MPAYINVFICICLYLCSWSTTCKSVVFLYCIHLVCWMNAWLHSSTNLLTSRSSCHLDFLKFIKSNFLDSFLIFARSTMALEIKAIDKYFITLYKSPQLSPLLNIPTSLFFAFKTIQCILVANVHGYCLRTAYS